MTTTSHDLDVDEDPTSSLILPLSPDALFQAIHSYVQSPSSPTAPFLSSIGGLPTLFTLSTIVTDPLTLRLVLSSLTKALNSHPPPLPPASLTPYITAGLQPHINPDVRVFVLSEVQRHLGELEGEIRGGGLRDALLPLLVGGEVVKGEDRDEAELREDNARQMMAPTTALFLSFASRSPANLQSLYSPAVLSSLLSLPGASPPHSPLPATVDRTRLLRVFSFYIDLACLSDDSRQLFLASPLPPLLLDCLRLFETDPLSQLNVVELLIRFIQGSAAFPPELASQLLHALYATPSTARPAFLAVATLQVAEALSVGGKGKADWWREEQFMTMLQEALTARDESIQLQAITSLCAVTAVSSDTVALFLPLCIQYLPPLVTSTSELLQLAALHGLTRIFAASLLPASAEMLFTAVGADYHKPTIAVLQSVLRTPFHYQRMAVFKLLKAVAGIESVQLLSVVVSPGWVEWLLDRGTEVELEGLRGKWEVLDAVTRNAKAGEMNVDTMRLVKEYVRQGPVYVAKQATVMNPLTRGE